MYNSFTSVKVVDVHIECSLNTALKNRFPGCTYM